MQSSVTVSSLDPRRWWALTVMVAALMVPQILASIQILFAGAERRRAYGVFGMALGAREQDLDRGEDLRHHQGRDHDGERPPTPRIQAGNSDR